MFDFMEDNENHYRRANLLDALECGDWDRNEFDDCENTVIEGIIWEKRRWLKGYGIEWQIA